ASRGPGDVNQSQVRWLMEALSMSTNPSRDLEAAEIILEDYFEAKQALSKSNESYSCSKSSVESQRILEAKVITLEKKVEDILSSETWRLGKLLIWLPRKIYLLIKEKK
ncbi:MAG: hypothetical protein LUH04_06280, partial [Clostridium sp.]|nr:hypothetical protein [Clostridium sp.]